MREKELLVNERDSLELKKLQSGQLVARQLERVSMQMKSVDSSLLQCQGGVVSGEGGGAKGEQRAGDFEQLSEER